MENKQLSVPLGGLVHLKRQDGRVDSYVFDGRFRNLRAGHVHMDGSALGAYIDSEIVAPEDDPNFHARLELRDDYFRQAGVAFENATEAQHQEADQLAERAFPFPSPHFAG